MLRRPGRETELNAILIAPNRELAELFLSTVPRLHGFQILGDLRSYPTQQTLEIRLRQLQPEVALIVGGMDRQLDYEQLDDYLLSGARDVHLIQGPTNGATIGRRFAAAHPEAVHPVDSLQAAVRAAAAVPGVTAVLRHWRARRVKRSSTSSGGSVSAAHAFVASVPSHLQRDSTRVLEVVGLEDEPMLALV